MTPTEKEELSILAGTRSRAANDMAAVRRRDLQGMLELPENLQSKQISAAPTQAEYNALQKDVANLHRTLTSVSASMRKANGR